MKKKQKIIVALSGGVDSSVVASILKKEGHDIIALFMRNWHDESLTKNNDCPWIEDSNYAMEVCQQLDIPFQTIDLSKEYKERIVDYMINAYAEGKTPNPDILCNREIKFDVFLKYALSLKADFIATGHYCIKTKNKKIYHLKQGHDQFKDQSYFLCQINQKQLEKVIFPIGHMTKKEVRAIAKTENLITANKKDSQGLCFVGKIKLPVFLQTKLKPNKGDIIEINQESTIYKSNRKEGFKYQKTDGEKIGYHNGAHYFTIGQRKGLNVGGMTNPLFVIYTDVKSNIVFVGMGENHPGLFRNSLQIKNTDLHWLQEQEYLKDGQSASYLVRIRHRQPLQKAILTMKPTYLDIEFAIPQRGIASGQFAAWYKGNELIGSGPII